MINLNPNATLTWHDIGHGICILVIDDAFTVPEQIRELAWKTRFHLPASPIEYYPGWLAPVRIPGEKHLFKQISRFFLDRLWPQGWPEPLTIDDMKPFATFSVFGLDHQRASENGYIDQHVDYHSWLATVAYIFDTPEQSNGIRGTAFWKHKLTGLQMFYAGDLLKIAQMERLLGLQFFEELRNASGQLPTFNIDVAYKMMTEPKKRSGRRLFSTEEDETWTLVRFVEAKFNRLIAYPTWQFRSLVDTVESSPLSINNARLTYNGFIPMPFPAGFLPQAPYKGGGYFHVQDMLIVD